jgi:hypothetical protein
MGSGLMITAMVQHMPSLAQAAILTIVLNGFNLLPLLPMDGGWFWHALIFSRNKWAESIFRILTGLGVVLGSFMFLSGSVILPIVGVFTMVGAFRTFKIAKITAELQAGGVGARLSNGGIPVWFTEEVMEKIHLNMPKAQMNAKQVGQVVLDVYERLSSPRATVLQVCLLALVYFGSLALALIFIVLPFVVRALAQIE